MIPALIPLDPTEPAVPALERVSLSPGRTLWRGHEIRLEIEPLRLRIDALAVPIFCIGPERYRTWILSRAEFRSPISLARAVIEVYFGLTDRTLPPPEVTEELELPLPD